MYVVYALSAADGSAFSRRALEPLMASVKCWQRLREETVLKMAVPPPVAATAVDLTLLSSQIE
jgi:hypothetical protein